MFRSHRLVLASSSPRRRELLDRVGLTHEVRCPGIDEERLAGESPRAYVLRAAREKADAVSRDLGDASAWVIGADTVVVLDGEPLGKPSDARSAVEMLVALGGREHRVLTGWAVIGPSGAERAGVEETRVWFRPIGLEEVEAYVATGEPLDKAGAYGIQGAGCFLVERIEGSYENVVGLPVCSVVSALQDLSAVEVRATPPTRRAS
jgi:septum formation protein